MKRPARPVSGKPREEKQKAPPKTFPRVSFIVCHHRKNKPKISPSVCEQRCGRTKDCREYFDYIQPAMFERTVFHRRGRRGR